LDPAETVREFRALAGQCRATIAPALGKNNIT
jgi:hypothetical protein